jgi:tripartite-type tricarboxylate transporter receptor subunit TctC
MEPAKIRSFFVACLLTGVAAAPQVTLAQVSPAEFYKSHPIQIIVPSSAGGGYDAIARTVQRHLGNYIPGNPTIIINNMPGAGGIRAANYLYSVAEKDGSIIGVMQNSIPFEPLVGNAQAAFDPRKFGWLGSPNYETGVLMVWHQAAATTIEELRKTEITVGVEAIASNPAFSARLVMQTVGLKMRLIPGYPGSAPVLLAMEKGEVDAFPNFYNSAMQTRPDWIRDKKTLLVVQWGPHREKNMPDVPYIPDIVTDPDKLALERAGSASLALGRPFHAPPGIPADRLAVLREAMMATFKDPAFIEETGKMGFGELAPQSGADLERIINNLYASSPQVIEQLKKIVIGN